MNESIYREVLDYGGYFESPASEEAVREMFEDYADSGYWRNVDTDELDTYTTEEICQWFMRAIERESKKKQETPICTIPPKIEVNEECSTAAESALMVENARISEPAIPDICVKSNILYISPKKKAAKAAMIFTGHLVSSIAWAALATISVTGASMFYLFMM